MRVFLVLLYLLIFSQTNAQNGYDCFNQSNLLANWKYLGPINNMENLPHQRFGNVTCININPANDQEIFVGSPTGALMHTTNRGKNWHALTDNTDLPIIGVNSIWVDYNQNPYHILLATGSSNEWYDTPDFGIFKSTDGGKTWLRKAIEKDGIFSEVYRNFLQAENAIFAISDHSIVQSKNGGESWSAVLSKDDLVGGHPMSERIIGKYFYEPQQNKIYFSTIQKWISSGNEDGRLYTLDLTNKKIEELTPLMHKIFQTEKENNGYASIQILPFKENVLLLAANHYHSSETYFYEYNYKLHKIENYEVPNAGSLSSELNWFVGFGLNKKNSLVRYLAAVQFYKSTDGGQTYKPLFGYSLGDNNIPHVDIRSMEITHHSADGKNDHIYIGTDGGLSYSDNGGESWVNLNGSELQLTQFYGLGSSEFSGAISAGAQDNSIITYLPNEKKWLYSVRGDGYDVAYDKLRPGLAYGQYNNRAMYSTNNDRVPFGNYLNHRATSNSNNRKTLVTHTNGDVFFAGQSLFHLKKGTLEWQEYPTPLTHRAIAIAVSAQNANIIYMSGLWGGLVKTTDGGAQWETLNDKIMIDGVKQGARIMSICVSPYDENRIWIGLGYKGAYDDLCKNSLRVLESRDGGNTWSNASDGLPVFAIQDIIFYEGSYESIFAATAQGIYYKRGAGYKWQRMSGNFPNCLVGELDINYSRGKLIAATYGRGLWETDMPVLKDDNPMIIKRTTTFTAPEGEAMALTRDITLRKRAKLIIDCALYIPKGGKIKVRSKKQVTFTSRGKLLNGSGEKFEGIVIK